MKILHSIGSCLVCLTVSLALATGTSRAQGGAVDESTLRVLAEYIVVPNDEALIARDYRLAFPARIGEEAVAFLGNSSASEQDRAAALVAIGSSKILGEQAMLEGIVLQGTTQLKRAAVIALGELGGEKSSFLIGLLDDPELGDLALVALLRGGSEIGRAEVLKRFRDNGADSDLLDLVNFVDEPRDYVEVPDSVQAVFQLRFEAARLFGLVDGQRWSVIVQKALMADDRLLDFVVFLAAADVPSAPVKDALLNRLLEAGDLPAVMAAARCMPDEVRSLMLSELWLPDSDSEWRAVLEETELRGTTLLDIPLLTLIAEQPSLMTWALRLRAELGDESAQGLLRDGLSDADKAVRTNAARGLGGTANKAWIKELVRMSDDPAPSVVAASLIGRVRLGDGSAISDLKELLANPEQTMERSSAIIALCLTAKDNIVVPFLESALSNSIGPEKLTVEVALRMRGDLSIGEGLREILGDEIGLDGRTFLVKALARNSAREDLSLFEKLFPSERFITVNFDMAVALARGGAPEGIEILRKALWQGPKDRSVLAAAGLIRHGGLQAITAELESASIGTTAAALRRVGYAVGVFGGLDELEKLRRRRGAFDAALQGAYLGALASRTM